VYRVYSKPFKVNKINPSKPTKHVNIELRFAFLMLVVFSVVSISNNSDTTPAINELTKILSDKVVLIEINGHKLDNPESILSPLSTMCNLPAHHSHPTNSLQLSIHVKNSTYLLELKRDSVLPNEYWVFFPAYARGVIGFICTDSLNGY
jgi:hypothetical protein